MTDEAADPPRRRAPGMSTQARREMIVRATLPLVAELGAAVTTQQIARAAGIGEATIFRAFDDKAALLRACVVEAMRNETLVESIEAVSADQPLEARLAEVAQTLAAHAGRVGAVVEALVGSGLTLHGGDRHGDREAFHAHRAEAMDRTADALAELIQPDSHRLRIPVRTAARSFQFLVMTLLRRSPGGRDTPSLRPGVEGIDVDGLIDLFLHGALAGRPEELSPHLTTATTATRGTGC